MSFFFRSASVVGLLCLILATSAQAAPTQYKLDADASSVGFTYSIADTDQAGTMPIRQADITIDPSNLPGAKIDILLNVAGARTPIFLATEALTGPKILDVARYPTIHFVSTGVTLAQDGRLSGGAFIDGRLTLRDVTRPIQLRANFFRKAGSAPNDFSQLTVHLTGALDRFDYGASGYAQLVGKTIRLDITVGIQAIK